MRVVIAGSTGLIGTALVSRLRRADHEVIRLIRRPAKAPDERSWDPMAGRLDPDALDGAHAVVNLCGAGLGDRRWSGEYKQTIRDSRIVSTDVLARAAAEHGVSVLLNASGIDYYGDTGTRVVDESSPAGTGFLADLCADWEDATLPALEGGVRVVRLRSGLVISATGGVMDRLRPLFRLGLGARLGNGRQFMPWISLADEVGAITHLLEHPDGSGPFNLCGPEPVTNAAFTKALATALRRPALLVAPAFALRLVLGAEFVEETALTGTRARPAALERHGYTFEHPTLQAALRAAFGR